MKQRSGRSDLLKKIYRKQALDLLQAKRSLSRIELAKQMDASRAMVDLVAEDLLRVGVALEEGMGVSTGGRPPAMLKFNAQAAYALGARLRDHIWEIVVTDLDAQVLYTTHANIPSNTPEATVQALSEGVQDIVIQVDAHKMLSAIGLGTPGLVASRAGTIDAAVDMDWVDIAIGPLVQSVLDRKTFVATHSQVGALAEFWHGPEQGIDDLIYIGLGTEVAAGIVHAGELYRGVNSSAGELGHVTILPDGPLCPCGNHGCLQQLVSASAITHRAQEKMQSEKRSLLHKQVGHHPGRLSVEMIFQAAAAQDPLALEIVRETATYLGIAVANLINLLNPGRIVIGGPLGQFGDVLLEPLQTEVQRRAMSRPLSGVKVAQSAIGPHAEAVGAAILVLQNASQFLFRA